MDSLSTRLAEIRKKAGLPNVFVKPNYNGMTLAESVKADHTAMSKVTNTADVVSEDTATYETPLWVLLFIHEKARRACGIDYNKGLTILIKWLGLIAIPKETDIKYPDVLVGWDTVKLSQLLDTSTTVIVHCALTEVLPRLNKDTNYD